MSTAQTMTKGSAAVLGREQQAKMQKPSIIYRREEYSGICAICKYAPTCIYPKDPERPVLLCEVFEAYTPRTIRRNGSLTTVAQIAEKNDSLQYVGLCANCEKRETCIYPKPEGGVWRCEEYE